MNLNETSLKLWFLVTFTDVEKGPNRVLWGIVAHDPSCRWSPGDWCCTSALLDQTGDCTFITKNTRYQVEGSGQKIELPVKALIELRQGVSPAEYEIMRANPELSLAAARQIIESRRDIEANNGEPTRTIRTA